jgi:hypothetical protein
MLNHIGTIYAAVIATVALGWQIYIWHRTRRTRVRVKLANAIMPLVLGGVEHVISVEVINDSGHQVRVTGFGLMANDGSGQQAFFISPVAGSTLPGPIAPHDAATGLNPWSGMVGAPIDFNRPVKAFAILASGERCFSKPTILHIPKELRSAA